ncbi:MAG TPA: preprotein translocase subunit SecA [Candidatus Cybelea sp.]|jgi:preprotein translocase subunit SecA|nr:preprotein translocase subunit SecA [Candidatus Cybelea sp.]
MAFLKSLVDGNEREVSRLRRTARAVNTFDEAFSALPDADLQAKTGEFKRRLEQGESLDAMLPEVFAVVREAGKRTLGMRHFDVQIMGGQVLYEGRIAEMKTGEGKTLVATLPVYARALEGRGVHVVTVNDYLARRDAEWMSPIYQYLGLEVGIIQHGLDSAQRRAAYLCDVTYVTNNECGFDYLRDNMAWQVEDLVQRELYFALVDEVDSILVDEARTPLIISGPSQEATELYEKFAQILPRLKKDEDFTVDEKAHAVPITEAGVARVEKILGIQNMYEQRNIELTHQLNAALRAWNLFHRDQQYIIKDGEVIIVDEFTGRLMYGRRYSDGIHQAIEAKEGIKVRGEDQTLATITFQNLFRLYEHLAGMTGTAKTEEREFRDIYGLDVVVVPTNMPMVRKDNSDIVYKSERAKFDAVVNEIIEEYQKGRPVLVGTRSIEKSELLATMLRRKGVECNVLNAKYHEQEAEIIKDAGQHAQVTIATNMAGRGTDIKLGEGVARNGGLHIIGTERHESRRIDNQLRGRSGRQGDPGSSRFYVSLEDEVMRLFGGERMTNIMERVGFTDEQPIESGLVSRSIQRAQSKVEAHNYEIRKHVLEYDDVMNKQRSVIYGDRRATLEGTFDSRTFMLQTLEAKVDEAVEENAPENAHPSEWDLEEMINALELIFPIKRALSVSDLEGKDREEIRRLLRTKAREAYEAKEQEVTPEILRVVEQRYLLLPIIDRQWVDHLYVMDHLKTGIGLRGYGQKDPRVEYEKEAFEIFESLKSNISDEAIKGVFRVVIEQGPPPQELTPYPAGPAFEPIPSGEMIPQAVMSGGNMGTHSVEQLLGPAPGAGRRVSEFHTNKEDDEPAKPIQRESPKVGRNELCPCGSGKKYKRCHGAAA